MVRRLSVVVILVTLVAAACGDDSAEPPTTAPDTQTTGATQPTAPTPGPGGFSPSECIELSMALAGAASMGFTGDETDIDAFVEAFRRMADVAPAEISADFVLVAEGYAAFARALADAGVDLTDPEALASAEAQAAFFAALEAFEASGAEEASDRIGTYMDAVCGD